jgi:hypothetical protein
MVTPAKRGYDPLQDVGHRIGRPASSLPVSRSLKIRHAALLHPRTRGWVLASELTTKSGSRP